MKVSRTDFVNRYSDKAIDLQKLEGQRGVSDSLLRKAQRSDRNHDGFISGKEEAGRLFNQLNRFDKDGSDQTVETKERMGGLSFVGKALEAIDKSSVSAPSSSATPRRIERSRARRTSTNRLTAADVDTRRMTESQKYDFYKDIIEEHGGKFNTGKERRNILSFRTETNTKARGGRGKYDDKTILLWQDRRGKKHVKEYKSNTEPSARFEGKEGVDANHDGKKDLGRLPVGYYEFQKSHSSRLGNILKPTRAINAERDTNHDGLFNDGKYASAGRSMYFHRGWDNMTGSAGCQTLPPKEFNRFWKDVNAAGNPKTIGYTLINLD